MWSSSLDLLEVTKAQIQKRQGRANTLINRGTSIGVALSGPIALAATHLMTACVVFAGVGVVTILTPYRTRSTAHAVQAEAVAAARGPAE